MMQFLVKVLVSALVIAGASELARRYSVIGALLAALPLTSILAMIWLWRDGVPAAQIADFSSSIFWLVLPSLVLYVVLPVLLKRGVAFWPSLGVSVVAMLASYGAMVFGLGRFGIKL